MTPYYEQDGITIYHGDCREFLHLRADSLITDPPYGIGMSAFKDDFDAVSALNSVNVPHGLAAIFMSPRRIAHVIQILPGWEFERLLWMHKTADIAAPWRGWCMNSEAILVMSRGNAKWPPPSDYRSDTYDVGPWERTGHPNGKPESVVRDLIRRLAVDGQTILDPFMGSGTTLVAAKRLAREAIGIEIEERYCEIAAKRLQQGTLPLSVDCIEPRGRSFWEESDGVA